MVPIWHCYWGSEWVFLKNCIACPPHPHSLQGMQTEFVFFRNSIESSCPYTMLINAFNFIAIPPRCHCCCCCCCCCCCHRLGYLEQISLLHVIISTFAHLAELIVYERRSKNLQLPYKKEPQTFQHSVILQYSLLQHQYIFATFLLSCLFLELESVQLRKHCISKAERHRARRSGVFRFFRFENIVCVLPPGKH